MPHIVAGLLWATAARYCHQSDRQATDTISRRREPPRSTSRAFRHTPSTILDARRPTPIARPVEVASTVAHPHQATALLPTAAGAGKSRRAAGAHVSSAAQGRRAAKWGQAADSLPKWSRMRRPVALGGDGNPFTPNQRLAVTPQRGAPSSRHEPPRAARRRALSQAAATAASAAPPPPRPLHRRRFSARMLPTLAISSSPCARPSQRARPKNRHRARVRRRRRRN